MKCFLGSVKHFQIHPWVSKCSNQCLLPVRHLCMRDHTPSVDHILYKVHPLEVWIAHLFLIVQRDYLWSERPQASFRNLLSETVLFHFFRSSWNCSYCSWMCSVCVWNRVHTWMRLFQATCIGKQWKETGETHVLLDSPARNMSKFWGSFQGKTFQVQVAVISNFIPPVANAVAWLGAKLGRQGDKELDGCDPPLKRSTDMSWR